MEKVSRIALTDQILPFWMNRMTDREHGGYYGRMTGQDVLMPQADKGAVLHARILWTFAAAYRVLRRPEYLEAAWHAKRYLIDRFYDSEYGGVYWMLDYQGNPTETKKQIYALGFAVYGLSELYRATGDAEALEYAIRLFESIEAHSFDAERNGYFEAFARDWSPLGDMRLSDKDANECKTMNTHLHLLEPYTNLYRVWPTARLAERLHNLIRLFLDKFTDDDGHLHLFFTEDWQSRYRIHSYGHEIEASWLLHEAALVLKQQSQISRQDTEIIDYDALLSEVETTVKRIAHASLEGYQMLKGTAYERNLDTDHTDTERHWWVQAETVVGNLNLYQYFGDKEALKRVQETYFFILDKLVDYEHDEWFWSVSLDDVENRKDDKAGPWKCPYHNGRMYLEIIERAPCIKK
ncbi:MAG: AGE family epimerase/isomerase [Prevotellaceae bacterium]|nr:AGE family epimerase/isomerase [Prevotellaceae bacterium]